MILYIESKAFPFKSFVVSVRPDDRVARVRAQLMHVLYELGREQHQFRLRHSGQYLRDALSLDDCGVRDNDVIRMVPLSKRFESSQDVSSIEQESSVWSENLSEKTLPISHVTEALYDEISLLNSRETLTQDLKMLFYLLGLALFFSLLTNYPYSVLWLSPVWLFGVFLAPRYTRLGGFIGRNAIWRFWFCGIYIALSVLCAVASVVMASLDWKKIQAHGCGTADGGELDFSGGCDHRTVFTAIFFVIHALLLMISFMICVVLALNFRKELGDSIEAALVQVRDVSEVLLAAQKGNAREVRMAAYELASLAATGDDTKFRIVAEGGLAVLNTVALSRDESTQEHAAEALAELLTIPSIQDQFMRSHGPLALTSLLLSANSVAVSEAAQGLTYVAAESENNKQQIVQQHGLRDVSAACVRARSVRAQRELAGLMLELAFSADIRMQMAAMNSPAQALFSLAQSPDVDTRRFALQALELLAITSPETVIAQNLALDVLLSVAIERQPDHSLLVAKLLLYYAESSEACNKLLAHSLARAALRSFGKSRDAVLQKVVAKIIFFAVEDSSLRRQVEGLQLEEVLRHILDAPYDAEARTAAQQALRALGSDFAESLGSRSSLRSVNVGPER